MNRSTTTVYGRFTRTTACLAALLTVAQTARASKPTVEQQGATLYITGDNYANTVSIIGAEDTPGTVGVYVNDVPWVYDGVQNIHVEMEGGDDFVGIDRIDISGDVTVLADGGDNVVQVGGWDYGPNYISGDVNLATGGGHDDVLVEDTWVGGSVAIHTGSGGDRIRFGFTVHESIEVMGNTIEGQLALYTAAGDDTVRIRQTIVQGQSLIDTGSGPDEVALGYDELMARAPEERGRGSFRDDERSGERGQMDLTTRNSTAVGASNMFIGLEIYTDTGGDLVGLSGNDTYMDVIIETGDENDALFLDAGNDFNGDLDAHGGNGEDFLFEDPTNYFASSPSFHSFELP